MFKKLALLAVSALNLNSALAYPPSTPDVCKTDGPVTVCSEYGEGGQYLVTYRGYLLDRSADIKMGGIVNGNRNINEGSTDYADRVMYRGDRQAQSRFYGTVGRHFEVQVYFYNADGEFDSRYGQNYRFTFDYDERMHSAQ